MDEEALIRDRELSIDGTRIHYAEGGAGRNLLLIHGLGGPLMWQRVLPILARRFHVVSIDLPGFGDSDAPNRALSADEHADVLVRAVEELGMNPVTVVGISYGGQVAAHLAYKAAAKMDRLVLICSTGMFRLWWVPSAEWRWKLFSFVVQHSILKSRSLLCALGRRSFHSIASRPLDLCDRFYRQLCRRGARTSWLNAFRDSVAIDNLFQSRLSSLSIPTLIVWGECDRTVPPNMAMALSRQINRSQCHTLPSCAHSVPLEQPEALVDVLSRFLSEGSPNT